MGEAHGFFCKICQISCSGPENYMQHMQGSKHLKKARLESSYGAVSFTVNNGPTAPESSPFYCEICKTLMSGPEPYSAHMMGAPHKKKLKAMEAQKLLNEGAVSTTSAPSSISVQVSSSHQLTEDKQTEPETQAKRTRTFTVIPKKRPREEKGDPETPKKKIVVASLFEERENDYKRCIVCEVLISGKKNLEKHIKGRKHTGNLSKSIYQIGVPDGLEKEENIIQITNKISEDNCVLPVFKEISSLENATQKLREIFDKVKKKEVNSDSSSMDSYGEDQGNEKAIYCVDAHNQHKEATELITSTDKPLVRHRSISDYQTKAEISVEPTKQNKNEYMPDTSAKGWFQPRKMPSEQSEGHIGGASDLENNGNPQTTFTSAPEFPCPEDTVKCPSESSRSFTPEFPCPEYIDWCPSESSRSSALEFPCPDDTIRCPSESSRSSPEEIDTWEMYDDNFLSSSDSEFPGNPVAVIPGTEDFF